MWPSPVTWGRIAAFGLSIPPFPSKHRGGDFILALATPAIACFPHSQCEPRAVSGHIVPRLGEQMFRFADKFFMQAWTPFEKGVDI